MSVVSKEIIIEELIGFVINPLKIRKAQLNCHLLHTFEECLEFCLNLKKPVANLDSTISTDFEFKINSILDYLHEELNTGHWSTVPIEIRQNFTIGSFLKALILLHSPNLSTDILQKCLTSIDMGLLLGTPMEENEDLLTETAKYLRKQLNSLEPIKTSFNHAETVKRKLGDEDYRRDFFQLNGQIIKEIDVPSIEYFNNNFFIPQIPLKLKGCVAHWPASTKWLDVNYLLKVAGNRTVPIEIGSHYTDENWSQKLMTLKEFITNHYLSETGNIGYLAQHNIFDQISELKEDIRIPEYCCLSLNYETSTEPDINGWFGPKGTVSPLHQDPKNNMLAQVYGTKQVLLFSPDDTDYLYPHGEKMLSNTAQVDPIRPDYSKYPEFQKARMYKCLLEPGEMLFIPTKWWHHVTAFEKSFSVSFWWQ